jgi:hypothetical protein
MNIAAMDKGAGLENTVRSSRIVGQFSLGDTKLTRIMIENTIIAVKSVGMRSMMKLVKATRISVEISMISQLINIIE